MKLISFRHEGREKYGVVNGDGIVDMTPRLGEQYATLKDAIAGLALAEIERAASGASIDIQLGEVDYQFPVTAPEKIFCIGRNYRAYHEVLEDGGPKWPSIFPRFASSFSGHNEAILRPRESDQLDYEGELGRDHRQGRAPYSRRPGSGPCRGLYHHERRLGSGLAKPRNQNCPGKNFFRSGSIGPWMVTRDEIADLTKLNITTRVDGEVRQDGGTDMMIFDIPFVISHISKFTWLEPGDMIATGSPGGSAIEGDPPAWLQPGQNIEIEIPPIGVLRNPIDAE